MILVDTTVWIDFFNREKTKKGITIRKTVDTIIASYCSVNYIKLLHNDKDLDYIAKFYPLDSIEE